MDKKTADAILAAFISPNVTDSNLEPANIVDMLQGLVHATRGVSHSISGAGTLDVTPVPSGITLADAVLAVAASLDDIASAVGDHGVAVIDASNRIAKVIKDA